MDDVWFGPGATRDDLEDCLHALSLHEGQMAPLIAVATGAEPRLILATHAMFTLFGATTSDALSERLLRAADPGAKRLASLFHSLPLQGAPRLERLRFHLGPAGDVITFLCRRVVIASAPGRPVFIAAALGVRGAAVPDAERVRLPQQRECAMPPTPDTFSGRADAAPPTSTLPQAPMSVQAIQALIRSRWPRSRTVRFLWQTDADFVCTQVTPPLAEVVGAATADLVGRRLLDLAATLDPSGRLAEALNSRATWSGLDVLWPIADAPAAVSIGLGAIAMLDGEQAFAGFRGYGVVTLDRVASREPMRFPPRQTEAADKVPDQAATNVVPFPAGAKALSDEDRITFDTLGVELRDQAGLDPELEADPAAPAVPEAAPAEAAEPVVPDTSEATPLEVLEPDASEPPEAEPAARDLLSPTYAAAMPRSDNERAEEIGRNGLAVLDRLATGILVSRDNTPIFANRHLLDMLGFADEDALHEAGGMSHLFGDQAGNTTGSEAVGVRGRDGTIVPTNARMQSIEWDGLPATLLTLQPRHAEPHGGPIVASLAPPDRTTEPVLDPTPPPEPPVRSEGGDVRELRAILETATDGVAIIDERCNVLSLNRSAEALLGCDRAAVIGKPFLDLFAPHDKDLAEEYFHGLKSNAEKSLLNDGREILLKASQGGAIPVFMTLGRLNPPDPAATQDQDGARFCALFRDLTQRKKVEQDLEGARQDAERANALKSDFLAKVSHEIRTPLNAIIGFAEVIMEERLGRIGVERYKEYLRDIHTSGTHVMSLVNDLLDLSKIEAGRMELAVEVIDLNKVIAECVAIMQPQASRERIIMRLSLAPHLPQIKADERSLRQIVLNLLSNGVKFNEPGGQVIVATAATEGGEVVMRIRDTGLGMSADDIATALEPFRQLSARADGVEGTGLGLPLTKALVEANEASFTIRSKVDQGTLVEVAFPPARVLAN